MPHFFGGSRIEDPTAVPDAVIAWSTIFNLSVNCGRAIVRSIEPKR